MNSLINATLLFWVRLGFEASAKFCDYLVYEFGIHEVFKTFIGELELHLCNSMELN